jgi:hypothetical protein
MRRLSPLTVEEGLVAAAIGATASRVQPALLPGPPALAVGGGLLLELLLKLLLVVGVGLPLIDADLNALQAQPLLLQGLLQLRQGAFEDALDFAALGQQADLDAILLLYQLQVHLAQFRRLQVHGQSLAALGGTQGKALNDLIQDLLIGHERGSGRRGR